MSTLRISNIEAKSVPASATIDEKVKITNSSGDVLVFLDGKTSGITTVGINTTDANITFDANSNVLVTGIITATKFSGQFEPTSVGIADSIFHTGDTNTAIRFPAADTISLETAGSERLRINSSGHILKGHDTPSSDLHDSQTTTGRSPRFQLHGANAVNAGAALISWKSGTGSYYSPNIYLARSGSDTIGTNGLVANDAPLGAITFNGDDGGEFAKAAVILGEVDGTSGADNMPGRLIFKTTPSGTQEPVERLRIDSSGRVLIGLLDGSQANASIDDLQVGNPNASTQTGITIGSNDEGAIAFANTGDARAGSITYNMGTDSMIFKTNGQNERLRITSSGDFGIGTNSPDRKLDVSGTGNVYGKFQSTDTTGAGIEVKDSSQNWLIQADGAGANSSLAFYDKANTTYRVHMKDNGNVEIVNGDLKVASGHGIDFSATNNSTASGASMNNELFDDYERGTFTPVMYGHSTGTGSNTVTGAGYYVKVGDTCTITINFSNKNGTGLPSGSSEQMRIAGLPFPFHNGAGNQTSAVPFTYKVDFNTSHMYTFIGANNNNYLRGYISRAATTWTPWTIPNWRVSQFYLIVNMTYQTV